MTSIDQTVKAEQVNTPANNISAGHIIATTDCQQVAEDVRAQFS